MSLEAWGDESPELWWNEEQIAEAESTIEALRDALAVVMNYPGIREYLGLHISNIADAALSPNASSAATEGETMRQTHEWPGHWTRVAPRVEDHPQGAELAWMARGYPFTRPVLARSNVGVKCISPQGICGGQIIQPTYGPFVRVELMADGFHGQQASDYGWFRDLEWLGPLVLPNVELNGSEAVRSDAGLLRGTD